MESKYIWTTGNLFDWVLKKSKAGNNYIKLSWNLKKEAQTLDAESIFMLTDKGYERIMENLDSLGFHGDFERFNDQTTFDVTKDYRVCYVEEVDAKGVTSFKVISIKDPSVKEERKEVPQNFDASEYNSMKAEFLKYKNKTASVSASEAHTEKELMKGIPF